MPHQGHPRALGTHLADAKLPERYGQHQCEDVVLWDAAEGDGRAS